MRRLVPSTDEVADLAEEVASDPRPSRSGRPWVMANMVMSVDGAVAVDGRSAPLSTPADRRMFHAVRSTVDVVMAGAGTVRAERYGRPRAEPWAAEARARRGQQPAPLLVVVTRSGRLPADLPLTSGDGPEPLVLHPRASPADLPHGVRGRAAGEDEVDLAGALAGLASEGHRSVLCEGGPALLGDLAALDLFDELFVTVSPRLAAGGRLGLLGGQPRMDRPLALHRVLAEDGALLLTYRRGGPTDAAPGPA